LGWRFAKGIRTSVERGNLNDLHIGYQSWHSKAANKAISGQRVIEAIRNSQKDNKLKVDSIMKPGGETENYISAMSDAKTSRFKCTYVFRIKGEPPFEYGAIHGDSSKYCPDCTERETNKYK